MTSLEKWNEIVDCFNSHIYTLESKVQNLWENIFAEHFGYSILKGEIDAHRSAKIGATDRTVPDIIIKDKELDLFIVELKQHNLMYKNGMENQLLSYMKLLNIDIGVLICNKIYIIDYSYNDNIVKKVEIAFFNNN